MKLECLLSHLCAASATKDHASIVFSFYCLATTEWNVSPQEVVQQNDCFFYGMYSKWMSVQATSPQGSGLQKTSSYFSQDSQSSVVDVSPLTLSRFLSPVVSIHASNANSCRMHKKKRREQIKSMKRCTPGTQRGRRPGLRAPPVG